MSNLKNFFKEDKKTKENVQYAATKDLVDGEENPLEWTLKHLTTSEMDSIRESCTTEIKIPGKRGQYRQTINNSELVAKLISSCVVFPNLNDAELQDSYGVRGAENLLREMVDNPGEYSKFGEFVQSMNGFDETIEDDIETAKN